MKSKIQMIQESIAYKHQVMESLNDLMKEFTISDNIFMCAPKNNNRYPILEVTNGYFEILNEYNDLNEAMINFEPNTQGIRIINNEKFQIGYLKYTLSECNKEHKIIDLYCGNYAN